MRVFNNIAACKPGNSNYGKWQDELNQQNHLYCLLDIGYSSNYNLIIIDLPWFFSYLMHSYQDKHGYRIYNKALLYHTDHAIRNIALQSYEIVRQSTLIIIKCYSFPIYFNMRCLSVKITLLHNLINLFFSDYG